MFELDTLGLRCLWSKGSSGYVRLTLKPRSKLNKSRESLIVVTNQGLMLGTSPESSSSLQITKANTGQARREDREASRGRRTRTESCRTRHGGSYP